MPTGVYAIINSATGRRYIGSSRNIRRRWNEHRSDLARGIHSSAALQFDWIEFGASAFEWVILQVVMGSKGDLVAVEQFYLDSTPTPYNVSKRAGSGPRDSFRHSEASKQRMSEVMKGKPKPVGFGAKVSTWRKGRALSLEHRAAIGRGVRGTVHSAESRAKTSRALKGRTFDGAKISAAKKGKPWSEVMRAKCGIRGPMSQEHKEKIRQGCRATFAKQRAKDTTSPL